MQTTDPELNVALNFDYIEQGAVTGAPKIMAWYRAVGLLISPVRLYRESLKLPAREFGFGMLWLVTGTT